MRSTLHLKASNDEIEAVFNTLDTDGGGSLDISELKTAMQRLWDAAGYSEATREQLRTRAALLHQHAQKLAVAAGAMEAAETEEQRVRHLRRPVEARLGDAILALTGGGVPAEVCAKCVC